MTTKTQTRRCIGSSRFPIQPTQKDGLGRMCKPHWREYTNALRKAAVARKAEATTEAPAPQFEAEGVEVVAEEAPDPEAPAPRGTRRAKAKDEATDEVTAA